MATDGGSAEVKNVRWLGHGCLMMLMAGIFFSHFLIAVSQAACALIFIVAACRTGRPHEKKYWVLLLPVTLSVVYGIVISENLAMGWREGRSSIQLLYLPVFIYIIKHFRLNVRFLAMVFVGMFAAEFIFALFHHMQAGEISNRWSGFRYAGIDGLYASLLFLLTAAIGMERENGKGYLFISALCMLFAVLTQSRGPVVFSLMIFGMGSILQWRKNHLDFRRLAFLLLLLLVSVFFLPQKAKDRVLRSAQDVVFELENRQSTASAGNRMELWRATWEILQDTAWLGTGYGDFKQDIRRLQKEGRILPLENDMHAHNIIAHSALCSGFIGVLGLLLTGIGLVAVNLKECRENFSMGAWCRILILAHFGLTGMFDAHFEHSDKLFYYMLCYTGMIFLFPGRPVVGNVGESTTRV